MKRKQNWDWLRPKILTTLFSKSTQTELNSPYKYLSDDTGIGPNILPSGPPHAKQSHFPRARSGPPTSNLWPAKPMAFNMSLIKLFKHAQSK